MAVCFDVCSGIVYQDCGGCFAHDQVSFYLSVQPISESRNAHIVRVWEICFVSLELCPVHCCRSVPWWIFWNFSNAISSVSTWPKACFMLVFSSSHVKLIPPSWFRKVSAQVHATPRSKDDAYPVFYSSLSNRFLSVRNFNKH